MKLKFNRKSIHSKQTLEITKFLTIWLVIKWNVYNNNNDREILSVIKYLCRNNK